eukprot:6177511-Pleurochrysis_carterae.AAC.2
MATPSRASSLVLQRPSVPARLCAMGPPHAARTRGGPWRVLVRPAPLCRVSRGDGGGGQRRFSAFRRGFGAGRRGRASLCTARIARATGDAVRLSSKQLGLPRIARLVRVGRRPQRLGRDAARRSRHRRYETFCHNHSRRFSRTSCSSCFRHLRHRRRHGRRRLHLAAARVPAPRDQTTRRRDSTWAVEDAVAVARRAPLLAPPVRRE